MAEERRGASLGEIIVGGVIIYLLWNHGTLNKLLGDLGFQNLEKGANGAGGAGGAGTGGAGGAGGAGGDNCGCCGQSGIVNSQVTASPLSRSSGGPYLFASPEGSPTFGSAIA